MILYRRQDGTLAGLSAAVAGSGTTCCTCTRTSCLGGRSCPDTVKTPSRKIKATVAGITYYGGCHAFGDATNGYTALDFATFDPNGTLVFGQANYGGGSCTWLAYRTIPTVTKYGGGVSADCSGKTTVATSTIVVYELDVISSTTLNLTIFIADVGAVIFNGSLTGSIDGQVWDQVLTNDLTSGPGAVNAGTADENAGSGGTVTLSAADCDEDVTDEVGYGGGETPWYSGECCWVYTVGFAGMPSGWPAGVGYYSGGAGTWQGATFGNPGSFITTDDSIGRWVWLLRVWHTVGSTSYFLDFTAELNGEDCPPTDPAAWTFYRTSYPGAGSATVDTITTSTCPTYGI